jgi:hypothetical protein
MLVAGLATLGLHVFVFLVFAGLLALSMALDALDRRGRAVGGVALALVIFAPLTLAFGRPAAAAGSSGTLSAVVGALEVPTWDKAETAWTWLFASYHRSPVDDGIQALWAFAVVAAAGVALRAARHQSRNADARAERGLAHVAVWCAASVAVFLAFGEYVGPPVNWWGASLRLPVIAALLGIVLVAPALSVLSARGRLVWLGFGGIASASFVAFVVATSLRFQQVEMTGFGDVIDQIPHGAVTCPLHQASPVAADFPGVAHGYVGNYVVARRGGVVPQGVFGNTGVMFGVERSIPQPGWGLKGGFSWRRHHRGCDLFLVRQSPETAWYPEQQSRVLRIASSPTWSLYAPTRGSAP